MASKGKSRSRREPTNLLTSVVLVMPLLLFYQVGVIFSDTMNGADLITQQVLRLLGSRGYIWFQLGLGATLVALVLYLRRTQQFELRQFIPVLLESGIYALTMGTLIIFLMVDLLHIDPRLAAGGPLRNAGVFDRLVMSVGAGVHEELVFRLVLLGGLAWIGERGLGLKRWLAILVAFVVSSLLFSAAHHVGSLGEPLRLGVFTYRTIAGLFFAALFQFRSFAIAVYTHALYDVYVLIWS